MKFSTVSNAERSEVGTLWSTVTSVQSGRRTSRPAVRRPSNAWGEVTSCTMWRSMNKSIVPSSCWSTTWSRTILSYMVSPLATTPAGAARGR